VALIAISVLSTSFLYFIAEGSANYGVTAFNESEITIYNRLAEIHNESESIKEEVEEAGASQGITDILGNFFTSAYAVLTTALSSISIFTDMINNAIQATGLPYANFIFTAVISAVIIILTLAIVGNVTKRNV
jgi:hypothetical protein